MNHLYTIYETILPSMLLFSLIFVAEKQKHTIKIMITSRKISQVKVFAGSPWEVASVKSLLNAAYIQVSTKDNGLNSILISVPCEYYTAAMRVINNRKVS